MNPFEPRLENSIYSNKPNQTLGTANRIVKNHFNSVSVSGHICIQMQAGLKSKFDMPQATNTHTHAHTFSENFPNNILLLKTFHFDIVVRENGVPPLSPSDGKNLPKFFNYNLICKWHREKHGKKLKWKTLQSQEGKWGKCDKSGWESSKRDGASGIKCLLKVSTD